MNEEKKPDAEEESLPAPESPPQEGEKPDAPAPLGGRSVFAYLAVLFGAAFLLLLFAYLMQQRDSEETRGYLLDLRESMGSIQSIDQLVEENRALREEVEALKGQVAELDAARRLQNNELTALQEQCYEASALSASQEKELASWLSFWHLETDFLAEDYEACAAFFRSLPADNVPYPDGQGVQERVGEIYAALVEQGVLAEGESWMAPKEEK